MKISLSDEILQSFFRYIRNSESSPIAEKIIDIIKEKINKVNSLEGKSIPYPSQEELHYFKLLFFRHKIRRAHQFFMSESKSHCTFDYFDILELNIIVLNNFKDFQNKISIYFKGEKEYSLLNKSVKNRLNFVNHVRNKAFGHVDDNVVFNGMTWVPQVYLSAPEDFTVFCLYKGIIESAINSYCDDNGIQKEFSHEIDINYTDDREEFSSFLELLNKDCLKLIDFVIDKIPKDFIVDSNTDEFILRSIAASKVIFDLKKGK